MCADVPQSSRMLAVAEELPLNAIYTCPTSRVPRSRRFPTVRFKLSPPPRLVFSSSSWRRHLLAQWPVPLQYRQTSSGWGPLLDSLDFPFPFFNFLPLFVCSTVSRTKHVWYSEHGMYCQFEIILERVMSVTHVAVILRTRTSPAYEEEFTKMDYPDARNGYGMS